MRRVSGAKQSGATKPAGHYVASEAMNVDEKIELLKSLGRTDLVEIFQDYRSKPKKQSSSLDQRVVISVTRMEKARITAELSRIESQSGKISLAQYIRNNANKTIDIQQWAELAEKELKDLKYISDHAGDLREKREKLLAKIYAMDNDPEDEGKEIFMLERDVAEIDAKLQKLVSHGENRSLRLSGYMSNEDAERVRWKAERLCLTVSEFLRFALFDFAPGRGDNYMGLDARQRFYVSVLDVRDKGWGHYHHEGHCEECDRYRKEAEILRDRVEQLEAFL